MTEIDYIPRFTLRDLKPIIDFCFKHKREVSLHGAVSLGGLSYDISFNPYEYELTFEWEDEDGQRRRQRVFIYGRESNLNSEWWVWYFVCPHTGRNCRKLYTDGKVIASRYAFPHTYSSRNQSHKQRELHRLFNYMETQEDVEKFFNRMFPRRSRKEKSL